MLVSLCKSSKDFHKITRTGLIFRKPRTRNHMFFFLRSLKIMGHQRSLFIRTTWHNTKHTESRGTPRVCTMLAPSLDNMASSSLAVVLGGTGIVSCLRIGPTSNLAKSQKQVNNMITILLIFLSLFVLRQGSLCSLG